MTEKLAAKYRRSEPGSERDGEIWTVIQQWPGTFGFGVMLEGASGDHLTLHSSSLVPPEWEAVIEPEGAE